MEGEGPYLWVNKYAPPAGFHTVPPGGMCIGVFLLITQGERLLLTKCKEHPDWEQLAGEDPPRVRADGDRWKLPARQLKLGEDPRDAARQIGEVILGLDGLTYAEPTVETEFWKLGADASGPPERRELFHYDMWLFVEAGLPESVEVATPPWFHELKWIDPSSLAPRDWARYHNDVVERWRARKAK